MANDEMTPREAEAFGAIQRFIKKQGWAPTMEELGILMGLRSKSWAYHLLKGLEKKGYVKLGKGPRMIRIIASEDSDPPEVKRD